MSVLFVLGTPSPTLPHPVNYSHLLYKILFHVCTVQNKFLKHHWVPSKKTTKIQRVLNKGNNIFYLFASGFLSMALLFGLRPGDMDWRWVYHHKVGYRHHLWVCWFVILAFFFTPTVILRANV